MCSTSLNSDVFTIRMISLVQVLLALETLFSTAQNLAKDQTFDL